MDNNIIPGLVLIEKETNSVCIVFTIFDDGAYLIEKKLSSSTIQKTVFLNDKFGFEKALDIKVELPGPAGKLSNLTPFKFHLDGIEFASMEAFLQSLKFKSQHIKEKIWTMFGTQTKTRGSAPNSFWLKTGKLYYAGKEVDRYSREYQILLTRAYDALFEQNTDFRKALLETKEHRLIHTTGSTDPYKTILTEVEFVYQLMRLRDKL